MNTITQCLKQSCHAAWWLLLLFCATGPVSADSVLSDGSLYSSGFESDTVGAIPLGWTNQYNQAYSQIKVSDAQAAPGGSKSLYLYKDLWDNGVFVYSGIESLGANHAVQFDFNVVQAFDFWILHEYHTSWGMTYDPLDIKLTTDSNGQLGLYAQGTKIADLVAGQWYNLIVNRKDAGKYDVYLDYRLLARDAQCSATIVYNRLAFGQQYDGARRGAVYLDNLRLGHFSVPTEFGTDATLYGQSLDLFAVGSLPPGWSNRYGQSCSTFGVSETQAESGSGRSFRVQKSVWDNGVVEYAGLEQAGMAHAVQLDFRVENATDLWLVREYHTSWGMNSNMLDVRLKTSGGMLGLYAQDEKIADLVTGRWYNLIVNRKSNGKYDVWLGRVRVKKDAVSSSSIVYNRLAVGQVYDGTSSGDLYLDNLEVGNYVAKSYQYGWYTIAPYEEIAPLADSGANLLVCYSYWLSAGNLAAYCAFLDNAALRSVGVFLEIPRDYIPSSGSVDTAAIIAWVKNVAAHPALAGWYLADEPTDPAMAPRYETAYNAIRSVSSKPVSMTFCSAGANAANYAAFKNAYDILQQDEYRCMEGEPEFTGIDFRYRGTMLTAAQNAPLLGKSWRSVTQAFYATWGTSVYRLPTLNEHRFNVFWTVVNGAEGVLNWGAPWCTGTTGNAWITAIFTPVANAVMRNGDAYSKGASEVITVTTGTTDIVGKAYEHPTGRIVALTVNSQSASSTRAIEVDLGSLMKTTGSYTVTDNDVNVSFTKSGNKIVINTSFTAYQVHVFEVTWHAP